MVLLHTTRSNTRVYRALSTTPEKNHPRERREWVRNGKREKKRGYHGELVDDERLH